MDDDERIVAEYLAWCIIGRGQSQAKDEDVIVRHHRDGMVTIRRPVMDIEYTMPVSVWRHALLLAMAGADHIADSQRLSDPNEDN